MARAKFSVLLVLALACAARGAEKDKSIHIPPGRSTGFSWYLNDGAGFRWDITQYGMVNDGTNDAYDGGMRLTVSGSQFRWSSNGNVSSDGREVEIGPWTRGAVRVWRRIYIDPKIGYARWIDIFENTSGSQQSLPLQYYLNMGSTIRMVQSSGGKSSVGAKDWGLVTAYSDSSSRPAVAHFFATKAARLKPTVRLRTNSDDLYYDFALKLPAKRTVALCFFEAQRRPFSAAVKLLKELDLRKELAKVPTPLRKIIVNMGGGMVISASLDLLRHEKHDLVVLKNENELLGTIRNKTFVIETFYGTLALPAAKVLGLAVPASYGGSVYVALTDGQIVFGRLANGPVRLRLTNGNDMSLPAVKIATAAFRLSPQRPEEVEPTSPFVVLRDGQSLFFEASDADYTFETRYGQQKLNADALLTVHLDTPGGGLHRAVFRNGTVLSGLMRTEKFTLRLALGPTLATRRHRIAQFAFPNRPVETKNLATLLLRNQDELIGRITQKTLKLKTRYGDAAIAPETIAEVTFREDAFGQATIRLHNGTTVSGRLLGRTIRFQITPTLEVPVFVGHIEKITCPASAKPAAASKPSPATRAAKPPTPTPTGPTSRGARPARK